MPQQDLLPPMPQSDFMNMMKQALKEAIDPQLAEIKNEVSATRHDIRQMSSRIDTIEHRLEDYDELKAEVKGLREEVTRLRNPVIDPELRNQLKAELQDELVQLLAERGVTREKPYQAEPPAAPIGASSSRTEFVPDKIFIKGFCEYSPNGSNGLGESECKVLFANCHRLLPREFARFVQADSVRCGYRRNHQIVIMLKGNPGKGAVYDLVQAWNGAIREKGLNVAGRKIWIQADAPEYVKQKRRLMAKAMAAAREELDLTTGGLTPEWPTFSLWWLDDQGRDTKIGFAASTCSWTWCREDIARIWPTASVDALAERASLS
jgi:hypothetical protein